MTSTARLNLPLIDAGQAQKNVTHNEAILALDQFVQASVLSQTLAVPPASNHEGDSYIVAAAGSGAWAGKSGQIAAFQQGAWNFYTPSVGCLVWVTAQSRVFVWTGTAWSDVFNLFSSALQNMQLLGIGTTATTFNPLSAKLNAALFTALASSEGGTGDMRFTLNKSTAGNTVSQLYQDGYSGRAETGLCGDDHFHIKVSADGSTWFDAVNINPAGGALSLIAPLPVTSGGTGATSIAAGRTMLGLDAYVFRNRLRNAAFAINQRVVSGTITLAAGAYGHDGVKAGASGATYTAATAGSDTTLTLTAGSLILPIEPNLIEGGSFTLSHAGTAQARVWQGTGTSGTGAYALASSTSPLTTTLTAATQTNVEFSTGTVLRPQLEPGSVVTAFERRPFPIEYLICQRYYLKNLAIGSPPTVANGKGFLAIAQATTSALAMPTWTFPTPMYVAPTVTLYSSYSGSTGFVGNMTRSVDVAATVVAANPVQCTAIITGASLTAGDQLACFMTAVAEI
jgi:hypothetical protein